MAEPLTPGRKFGCWLDKERTAYTWVDEDFTGFSPGPMIGLKVDPIAYTNWMAVYDFEAADLDAIDLEPGERPVW